MSCSVLFRFEFHDSSDCRQGREYITNAQTQHHFAEHCSCPDILKHIGDAPPTHNQTCHRLTTQKVTHSGYSWAVLLVNQQISHRKYNSKSFPPATHIGYRIVAFGGYQRIWNTQTEPGMRTIQTQSSKRATQTQSGNRPPPFFPHLVLRRGG